MKRSVITAACACCLALLLSWGCGEAREPDAAEMARAVADASTRPGTVIVEARRVDGDPVSQAGKPAPRLVIDRAAVAPGASPRLVDDQRLAGRIELLDEAGETIWSMGYQPARSSAEVLRLRAPWIEGGVTVRLTEPKGDLSAQAKIER